MNSSAALTAAGHSHTTLSGVRTMSTTSTTSWIRKQPSPGPRSGSRSSPLYWTGPVGRGRLGGVGSARGSIGGGGGAETGVGTSGGGVGSLTGVNATGVGPDRRWSARGRSGPALVRLDLGD